MHKVFYNTQHAPVGAFASFTLGNPGASGGLGLELGEPTQENLWIGYEDSEGVLRVLPFYADSVNEKERFEGSPTTQSTGSHFVPFVESEIIRELSPCRDTWIAGDMRLSLITRAPKLSDPNLEDSKELRLGLVPAILCEMVIDNRKNPNSRLVFWGWQGSDRANAMRCVDMPESVGIAQGQSRGFFGHEGTWVAGQGFSCLEVIEAVSQGNIAHLRHAIGPIGVLVAQIPAGSVATIHLTASFWRGGDVTVNRSCRYLYNRWWKSLEDVSAYLLSHIADYLRASRFDEEHMGSSHLNRERRWMLSQAIHSYYGSTQLLEDRKRDEPLWIVNEGEYKMINTLDLVVDHVFYELKMHPWSVRSVLDTYLQHYSAVDSMGLLFTHDMGVANAFSSQGQSSYEQAKRKGCFSFMCQEELVNWILCATLYAKKANDIDWLLSIQSKIDAAFQSLINRDHSDPELRTGLMQFDSDRCDGGREITTYDSLDESLGPACGSLYLAVKTWATWRAFEWNFKLWDKTSEAKVARQQAERAAQTILKSWDPATQIFPAMLNGSTHAAVIPAVEGVLFYWLLKDKKMNSLTLAENELWNNLKIHLKTVLLARCRFEDGGWKLSETSPNSWLSKIFLAQAIAEKVFEIQDSESDAADHVHQAWLQESENSHWAFSDQMNAGVACGSKYYPRGVTAILWCKD